MGGRVQILLDGVPTHSQMTFDLADGPTLDPIQVVQLVDLIGGEHDSTVMNQKRPIHHEGVVCKHAREDSVGG